MERPDFTFSFPDARYLPDKINPQEILSVFNNQKSITEPRRQYVGIYYYVIGFSQKKRFLQLFLNYADSKVNFIQAKVADEDDIMKDYCRQK